LFVGEKMIQKSARIEKNLVAREESTPYQRAIILSSQTPCHFLLTASAHSPLESDIRKHQHFQKINDADDYIATLSPRSGRRYFYGCISYERNYSR
jgi:hypothetical protein